MTNTRLRLHEVTRNRHYRHHARAYNAYAELHVTNCNRNGALCARVAELVPMPPIWRAGGVAGRGYAFALCFSVPRTVSALNAHIHGEGINSTKIHSVLVNEKNSKLICAMASLFYFHGENIAVRNYSIRFFIVEAFRESCAACKESKAKYEYVFHVRTFT